MKSRRSVYREAEETVHGSAEEDQVKAGHIAERPLGVPALWWELLSGSMMTSGIAMGLGWESPNYRHLEHGISQI